MFQFSDIPAFFCQVVLFFKDISCPGDQLFMFGVGGEFSCKVVQADRKIEVHSLAVQFRFPHDQTPCKFFFIFQSKEEEIRRSTSFGCRRDAGCQVAEKETDRRMI